MAFQQILFSFLLLFVTSFASPDEERNGRVFSLFSVVNFPNEACGLTSGLTGKCYTASECTSKGGVAEGACAAGFGVCCRLEKTTCGSEISQNGSYIVNTNATGTCSYTIKEFRTGICQIRLDFVSFSTITNTITTDTFVVTTTTGYKVPPIAGTMTGQHIYIDADRASSTKATLTFTQDTADTTTLRFWRILVTQYACDDPLRAPSDCLQYFTGISDVISSFNYPNSMLAGQAYNICVKQRQGYCAIDYSTTDGTPDGFKLGKTATTALTDSSCMEEAWISIENVISPVATLFCGEYLSNVPDATSSGVVRDVGAPFEVGVNSPTTGTPDYVGFQLTYSQVPCS